MNTYEWMIIILLSLITILLFFRVGGRNVSYFAGSNTLFAMNELDWIPSDLKIFFRDQLNDEIVPALKTLMQRSWDSVSTTEKTKIFDKLTAYVTTLKNEINNSTIGVTVRSPSP